MHRLFSIFLFLLAGSHAFAVDFVGRELIIPVVGRTPGAFGSQWQTDLVVSNVAEEGPPVPVTITLMREGQPDMNHSREIGPQVNVVTRDILQATFDLDVAVGMIRVSSTSANARLSARARIYNVGSAAGEFGQSVQAFPITSLSQWVSLPGVSGLNDNRTNVGISNPWGADTQTTVTLLNANGIFIASARATVPARGVLQLNDIFAALGAAPLEGATVRVQSDFPVYAYASVVRNDSGDAVFVMGVRKLLPSSPSVVTPTCLDAAPLNLALRPAPGWVVFFDAGIDANQETPRLAAAYNFTPTFIYTAAFQGFSAPLTAATVAAIRCESSVKSVAENAIGF